MVKIKIILGSILIMTLSMSSCGNRCKRIDGPRQEYFRSLQGAESFNLSTPAEMTIEKDSLASASLEIIAQAELYDALLIENTSNDVTIRMNGCFKDQETLLLNATLNNIDVIEFSSAGKIKSAQLIEQDTISVDNSGLGDIDLLLSSQKIKTNSSSSGNIILSGEAQCLTAVSLGSGELSAFNLFSDSVRIGTSGSGIIEVYANTYLEIDFKRPTIVRYRGNPEVILIKGEGEVVDANL
ncbi:DUF2807 domain-containing protein [Salibacteraceae bacterium]|nr:DUF2807 domain-containing protein [Salibacteraceae bacterium]MDB9708940.1 DUF2807 domain-containing protein [Salibacteraceae bacterium]